MTLRHLLTFTAGFGIDFGQTPYSAATRELLWGPNPPDMDPDTYLARLTELPLAAQPGQRWMYHSVPTCSRSCSGKLPASRFQTCSLSASPDRLAWPGPASPPAQKSSPPCTRLEDGELVEAEDYRDAFSVPPRFESLAGGMVSTVPDYLAFLAALADDVLLPAGAAAELASDQLVGSQRARFAQMAGSGPELGLHDGGAD